MPDPVNPRDNAAVRQFYKDDPTGPSAAEVKDAQQPTREIKGRVADAFGELAGRRRPSP